MADDIGKFEHSMPWDVDPEAMESFFERMQREHEAKMVRQRALVDEAIERWAGGPDVRWRVGAFGPEAVAA